MKVNAEGVLQVLSGVSRVYIRRFEETAWDIRLLEQTIKYSDFEEVAQKHKPEIQGKLREALTRFRQPRFEGYPAFKYGHTFFWVEVESFINAFIKSWLEHVTPPAQLAIFEKVKFQQLKAGLSVSAYEQLSRDEVLDLYVEGLKTYLRKSSEIKTFFAVLDEFGLKKCDFALRDSIEKTFTELQQIRNIMVHNDGIVDKRMMEACPWLEQNSEIQVGQRFPLNDDTLHRYTRSMFQLGKHVTDRIKNYLRDSKEKK